MRFGACAEQEKEGFGALLVGLAMLGPPYQFIVCDQTSPQGS